MSNNQLVRIFGILHSFERIVAQNRQAIEKNAEFKKTLKQTQKEQEKIVRQMRRSANLLQLAIATNKPNQLNKQLQIFYGLHFLAKDEILSTVRKLSEPKHNTSSDKTKVTLNRLAPVPETEKHIKWH